jgi:hypothetical protein
MKKTLSILSVVAFGGMLVTAQAGDHGRDYGRFKDVWKSFCQGISSASSFVEAPPATIEAALRDCLSQCNESDDGEGFACVREISTTLRPIGPADEPGGIEVTGLCLRARWCPELGPEFVPPTEEPPEIGVIGPGTGEVCFTDSDCVGGPNFFCQKDPGICNNPEVPGVCSNPLVSCIAENDPSDDVCGCDGNTYPNTCGATATSVNVDFVGPCPE